MNEVLANRASELLGGERGEKRLVHPNDDVNRGQSSNDVFPTAMHVAAVRRTARAAAAVGRAAARHARREGAEPSPTSSRSAAPTCRTRRRSPSARSSPATSSQLDHGIAHVEASLPHLCELALGGTAVGTGLNAHPEFAVRVRRRAGALTGLPFVTAPNKFEALAAHDALVFAHGALKTLAASLMKIANDVRWLASGPRCGIGELTHPRERAGQLDHAGQGQPDAVRGADHAVRAGHRQRRRRSTSAARSGNFELNVFKPLIIHNFLQSVRLLADGARQLQRQLRGRHRAQPRAHRAAAGPLADAGDRAQPAHRLRQGGGDRQERAQGRAPR